MPGQTRRSLWSRCSVVRRRCGRSTARSLRPTRARSRRRIMRSQRDGFELPSMRQVAFGFSGVLPIEDGRCELDDLFVEPDRMRLGVGRLLVADLASRAADAGARYVDVIANPNALGFYERVGFQASGDVPTRFGRGVRMTLDLSRQVAEGALSFDGRTLPALPFTAVVMCAASPEWVRRRPAVEARQPHGHGSARARRARRPRSAARRASRVGSYRSPWRR